MQVVPKEGWEGYSYSTATQRVFVSFPRIAEDLDRNRLRYCARVIIEIKAPNHNGGPTGDEANVLWSLEDDLCTALHIPLLQSVMVGRLTHGGSREIVFQLADWNSFRPVVGQWLRTNPVYSIDVSEHDGWDFYDDSIRPSAEDWQLIMDRKVIDQLIQAGSDPKKEHSIEFVFIGGPEKLSEIEARLSAHGYSTVSLQEETLVTAKKIELDIDKIYGESRRHLDLAKEFDAKYDGWGALVVD